jgi:signal transduction histidine kinase
MDRRVGPPSESQRVAEARSRAERRLNAQRDTLRPLGWGVIVVVVVTGVGAHPGPGLHGNAIGVTLALGAFVGTLMLAIGGRFITRSHALQATVLAAMGASGVALAALQPRGATFLAGGAAVWMGIARLPLPLGVALGAGVTVALDVAAALAGGSSAAVLAATLLCALLGLMAYFMKQARESQDRTEVLLAQLQDAREEQTLAAAIAERGRIASELHDVLAHSLSGAAIGLQGARMLAEREQAGPQLRAAIDRASELVSDGLASARQAVGALRGQALPSVAQLASLVESFRADMDIDVTLSIEGGERILSADASLALYRGVQEALTNVARYAPGAVTSVVLSYDSDRTTLIVEDRIPTPASVPASAPASVPASAPASVPQSTPASASPGSEGLTGVGGGRGLSGMRERLERAGGSMYAGPTDEGWRVELDVPA